MEYRECHFALGFPPQDIRFSMVRFSYHYLTELVFGALSIVSGIACYDIYVFYAGPLVLAALLCCLYALGICFTAAIGTRRYCSPSPCFCSTAPACGQL